MKLTEKTAETPLELALTAEMNERINGKEFFEGTDNAMDMLDEMEQLYGGFLGFVAEHVLSQVPEGKRAFMLNVLIEGCEIDFTRKFVAIKEILIEKLGIDTETETDINAATRKEIMDLLHRNEH